MTEKKESKTKNLTRRSFISTACLLGYAGSTLAHQSQDAFSNNKSGEKMRPAVIFLDVNETTLDLNVLKSSVGKALDNRTDLLALWFSTMLHHSLVSSAADQYADFGEIGVAAMVMVAENNGIKLSTKAAKEAVSKIKSLPAHKDVKPALKRLKAESFKLYTLTNSSNQTVQAQMKNAGLDELLDDKLSIEDIGIYKPNTHVYRWAARKVGEKIENCMLVAAHGWDVAGALWSGMRASFIDRPGQSLYPLAPKPEFIVPDFGKLADALLQIEK